MARIARGDAFIDAALEGAAKAQTVEQLRQAQAVLLPLRCGMSLEETAQVTGISRGWVSQLRNRFMRGKLAAGPDTAARGGRRRQHFTLEQEAELLKPFLEEASKGGVLVVGQIKPKLEAALGRPMALSTVYALLHRHNWRKLAPDKRHPKSDPAAQEDFKKNSRKRSRRSGKIGQKINPSD
jgi:transposase